MTAPPRMHGLTHRPGGSDPIPGLTGGGGGPVTRLFGAGWTGGTPDTSIHGNVWKVPKVDETDVTFTLQRMLLRLETPGSGTTTVRLERAPGGDVAFVPTTVTSVSVTGGSDYENETTSGLGTVDSGDLIRIVWTAVGTGASDYLVELEGIET